MPRLRRMQIELTDRCNEKCVHCYVSKDGEGRDMRLELLSAVLDQGRVLGLEQVVFSGGEPMLHPGFFDALARAGGCGLKMRVFSNLTLLDDDAARRIQRLDVCEVQTSLYCVAPGVHDAVTGTPGSCAQTMRGIERLAGLGVRVFVNCPVIGLNKESYPGVMAFAGRLGVGVAPDNMIMVRADGDRSNLEHRLNIDEALRVIRDILDNDSAYDDEHFSPSRGRPAGIPPRALNVCCEAVCVNAKGEVLPLPEWNLPLGDLNRQSLKDVWENSPAIKRLREIGPKDFPKCRPCTAAPFCTMGLGGNANESPDGDPLTVPPHVCELAEKTRTLVHSRRNKHKETT